MEKRRSSRKNRKKKLVLNIVLVVVVLILLVAAFIGGSMYIEYNSKGLGSGETVTIEIEQGAGSVDIATKLKEEGLIKHRIVFLLKARSMGVSGQLRYGVFDLHKDAGLETLIQELVSGGAKKEEAMFTIPEGYSIEMIALKLEEEGFCTALEFLEAVEREYDYSFLESVPTDANVKYRLQGFLYPDTYSVFEDATAEDIVRLMLEQFGNKFTSEMQDKASALGKSIFEVVTEASVVEREAQLAEERSRIAGVFENRLEVGMRLQVDPTVLYPLTDGLYDVYRVTYADLEIDSPYNTYKYTGLPVGPICNPGIACLEAVLEPEEHDYLYYHTDTTKNDGSHIFTKTYQDHLNTQ